MLSFFFSFCCRLKTVDLVLVPAVNNGVTSRMETAQPPEISPHSLTDLNLKRKKVIMVGQKTKQWRKEVCSLSVKTESPHSWLLASKAETIRVISPPLVF